MSRISILIETLCPDGVKYTPIGNVLKDGSAKKSVTKNEYKDKGKYPIIDQSQADIAGFTDKAEAVPPTLPCIIFGDHTRIVKYADTKFAQGSSGTRVFVVDSGHVDPKYVYYAMSNLKIESRGYNRHWSVVKDMEIPLPPLPVQEEIVRILDTFTELIAELKAELTARKKQYEFYRDELLKLEGVEGVEWKKLGEIGVFYGGLTGKSKNDFTGGNAKYVSYVHVFNNAEVQKDIQDMVRVTETEKQNTLRYGDIIFTGSSETLDECGMSAVLTHEPEGKLYLNSFCFGFRPTGSDILLPSFSKHLFRSHQIRRQIVKTAQGVTRFNVSKKKMVNVLIPLPPLPVQEEIVRILDTFTELIAELTAEIELRQKQYEFYREKLLTF